MFGKKKKIKKTEFSFTLTEDQLNSPKGVNIVVGFLKNSFETQRKKPGFQKYMITKISYQLIMQNVGLLRAMENRLQFVSLESALGNNKTNVALSSYPKSRFKNEVGKLVGMRLVLGRVK